MHETPEIRPLSQPDIEPLSLIGLKAWQSGIKPLVPEHIHGRMLATNPFAPFLEKLGKEVLVAEVERNLIGFAACEHADNHISDLWVDPAFEGRGIGSALLHALEARILDKGYNRVTIQVAAGNARALGLYQHLGYRVDWRETRLDPILETRLEKIGLSKTLFAST